VNLREKVIKGLECCLPMTTRNGFGDCKNCPYDREITLEGGVCECCHELMMDALELVNRQEPVDVHDMILGIDGWGGYCPVCGSFLLEHHNKHFCGNCGQEVKWE